MIYRKNVHSRLISKTLRKDCVPISGSDSDRFLDMSKVRGLITLMKATAQQIRACNLPQIIRVLGLNAISQSTIGTLCSMIDVLDHRVVSTVGALNSYALAVGASMPPKERKALLVLSRTLEKLERRMQELRLEEFVLNVVEVLPFAGKMIMEKFKEALSGMAYNFAAAFDMAHPSGSSDKRAQRLVAFLDHVELHLESSPIYTAENRRNKARNENKNKNKNKNKSSGKGRGDGDVHEEQEQSDGVWMGTVHQAKGLEWDHVFVLHMNEGQFPLDPPSKSSIARSHDADSTSIHMEAERRLAFVAASRARQQLTFTLAIEATGNRGVEWEPSRFLKDIPKRIVKRLFTWM